MIEENAPVHCPGTDLDLPFEEDAQDGLSNIPKRRTESSCIIESRAVLSPHGTSMSFRIVAYRFVSFRLVSRIATRQVDHRPQSPTRAGRGYHAVSMEAYGYIRQASLSSA